MDNGQTKPILGELAKSSNLNMKMLWINETQFSDVPEIDNKNL